MDNGEGMMGSMVFITTRPIVKGGQLNMMYAEGEKQVDGFFAERGLTRCDVWTKVEMLIFVGLGSSWCFVSK